MTAIETAPPAAPTDDPRCPACGAGAEGGQRFCARCGLALPAPPRVEAPARRRIGGTPWSPVDPDPAIPAVAGGAAIGDPVPASAGSGRRRRRRRAWYRRPLVVAPLALLLLVGMAVGAVAYRAQATLDDLQGVSTLPPRVTDATEGDDGVPAGLEFDTGPARQALADARIEPVDEAGGGVFGSFKDAAGDVGDLADGAAVAAGVKESARDAVKILVMGVDTRPGAPIDIGVRPDAIMVLHLDPSSGSCRGLAIPRDTYAELPGYGMTKINHALMVGGIPYQKLVVERYLGIPINHYALIDFVGFKELVDAVDGVPVTVPSDLTNGRAILFSAGPQTFDGDQALSYARYRGGPDADIGRVRRQQQIIRGLVQVGGGRDLATDIGSLLPALSGNVRTDLGSAELIGFAEQYRAQCGDSALQLDALLGNVYSPGTPDPLYMQELDYVQVDPRTIEDKVAALSRP